jgi:regulator of replication initiation timing
MPDNIDPLAHVLREATAAMEQASHQIQTLVAEIERLRLERDVLRRALYETSYCLHSLDVMPSAMTKTTADTIVQLNLGGFND